MAGNVLKAVKDNLKTDAFYFPIVVLAENVVAGLLLGRAPDPVEEGLMVGGSYLPVSAISTIRRQVKEGTPFGQAFGNYVKGYFVQDLVQSVSLGVGTGLAADAYATGTGLQVPIQDVSQFCETALIVGPVGAGIGAVVSEGAANGLTYLMSMSAQNRK